MENKSNYTLISNTSFVLSIFILLVDIIALFLEIDINKTTLWMSILLGILLFFNGILYKKKASDKK